MPPRILAATLAGGLAVATGALLVVAGTGAAAAATAGVQVVDNSYGPATVTIEVGDTVRWTWAGQERHSVTSADGRFDSHPACTALLTATCGGPGYAFEHTFDSAGTYAYRCRVHGAAMSGTVVVREPAPDDPPPAEDDPDEPSPAEQPGEQPAPAPAPPPQGGGHTHGRAVGPRVGTIPPPPPQAPQVADPSPRPVGVEEAANPPPAAEAASRTDGSEDLAAPPPPDERRTLLLLAAAATVAVSATIAGAVALFGGPRRS